MVFIDRRLEHKLELLSPVDDEQRLMSRRKKKIKIQRVVFRSYRLRGSKQRGGSPIIRSLALLMLLYEKDIAASPETNGYYFPMPLYSGTYPGLQAL